MKKFTALKVAKSVAIAVVGITGGVFTGTVAQAASAHQSNNLTITNDTTSEVLVFLHQDGDNAAYTRYAYLPACSERRLLDDYTHGWHFSINLNRKMPLVPNQAGALRIFASGYNGQIFPTPCTREANGDASLRTSLNPHPVEKTTLQEVSTITGVIGVVQPSQVPSFISNRISSQDNLVSDLGLSQEKLKEAAEHAIKNGNDVELANKYFGGDPFKASILSLRVEKEASNKSLQQISDFLTINHNNDRPDVIQQKSFKIKKLIDEGKIDQVKRILKKCKLELGDGKPGDIENLLESTEKLVKTEKLQRVAELGGEGKAGVAKFTVFAVGNFVAQNFIPLAKTLLCPTAGYERTPQIKVQSEV